MDNHLLEDVKKAAREAGELLLARQEKAQVSRKNDHELVTEADFESEKLLRERLCAMCPDTSFLGEESWNGTIPDPPVWVVDPLDGTNNYAHGYPVYCVSIARVDSAGIQMGCIFDPSRDEMFSALRGESALLNGRPIEISGQTDLGRSLLCTGFPYHRSEDDLGVDLRPLEYFLGRADGIRRGGSAALDLAYVACGRLDGFWEEHLKPWDMAAGVLVVREAGGEVTDCSGKAWSLSSQGIVAATQTLLPQLLEGLQNQGGLHTEDWTPRTNTDRV